ncbi:MAG: hypothetical protein QGI68_16895 [Pseudomonadales bacterium]|jgi:hypothetical protein|nr:hypothetical protein [Pseudomonadales bacterium]MDP7360272.1 hypothetical protein [Pseudomonadales bacterium]MDP7597220.1 hypothetical protein [Pseudomonadales bacterium]HJN52396.1 hypothetical protein [Pseudomonadales bacterium]|tara:strand:- start:9466 stop:10422 length:957 start_codon:yes stop_codon:yes gene_type:complete
MKKSFIAVMAIGILAIVVFGGVSMQREAILDQLPEYEPRNTIENHQWFSEELITILEYSADAMEIGISPDDRYLLFNDRQKPNKDMHWAARIDAKTYKYQGKVANTVTDTVDGTPSFDGQGNIFFTTLKTRAENSKSLYKARFEDGVAHDPVPVAGNIHVENRDQFPNVWISLDPDISDDGRFLFYSEGRFNPLVGLPYPFNIRGAERVGDAFVKMDDRILANVNSHLLDYAPTISSDGLEIFFSRIGKVNGIPDMIGIFTARRANVTQPFAAPERIMAITGKVEAPVLSGDEMRLYYHRMDRGRFRVYRVTRRERVD